MQLPPLENAPEAPVAGAEKVTLAPETGLPNWSTSWTSRPVPNAVLTGALWPLPATMVMVSFVVLAVIVTAVEPQLLDGPLSALTVQVPAASPP